MIVMEMRNNGIVYLLPRSYTLNICGDPFIGSFGAVRTYRRIARRSGTWIGGIQLACIEKNGGAVGKDIKGGIAAACIDMMEIQVTLLPGRQRLANSSDRLAPDDQCH